jgi:putative transposase
MRTRSGIEPLKVRQSRYMNNRVEQDHRCIKLRILSMLGFKSAASAAIILEGIELVRLIHNVKEPYSTRAQICHRTPSPPSRIQISSPPSNTRHGAR